MSDEIRVCIDRLPPPKTPGGRLALIKANCWQGGEAIAISFMDGQPALWDRVKTHARTWQKYTNLSLFFRQTDDTQIRISFKQKGSWSHIGTACRTVPKNEPTMNFGWLTPESSDDEVRRVVLHEFGHALACIHEHQNPAGGIKWNKQAVYDYFSGEPNYWTKEQIDHNLLETYDKDMTAFTKLDPKSIMMYPIDRRLTEDGLEVGWNRDLSDTDKDFIFEMYP